MLNIYLLLLKPIVFVYKNYNLCLANIDDDAVDNSLNSLESQTEKDSEYTEKFGTLPRTILKSPTPTSR